MLNTILFFPGSKLLYFAAIASLCITGLLVIAVSLNIWRFVGLSLSQWIDKTRQKTDAVSAQKLIRVRKLLENLAHDVLKHRLLGLHSLVGEIASHDGNTGENALSAEKYDDFREEIFRLCGVKSIPSERLWTKWLDTFAEVRKIAGRYLILPSSDPLLKDTSKVMRRLRLMFSMYIAKDRAGAVTPEYLQDLGLERSSDIHQKILALAEGCRMRIDPDDVIKRAIESLSVQVGRHDVEDKIEVINKIGKPFLSPIPSHELVLCLMRLLDNAITHGGKSAISVELSCDDFTGASFLSFKIYDCSAHIPTPSDYGLGLKGVKNILDDFESGFRFRAQTRGEFQKEGLVSIPVSAYTPLEVKGVSHLRLVAFAAFYAIVFMLFIFAGVRVSGGPPVSFAGGGTSVVEFAVTVGERLEIPLCEGGRNVRTEISVVNDSCWEGNCSLGLVLENLKPCEKGLHDPLCPASLVWTPDFEDGQRQGKSYEIYVRCIADGPPESEASTRIRILVSRPNSSPELLLLQVENLDQKVVHTATAQHIIPVAADDKLRIRAVALDRDSDIIAYRLRLPNGRVLVSYDGIFSIEPEWTAFATWTADLELTDQIAPVQRFPIQLRAEGLRPIELRNIGIWTEQLGSFLACDGAAESRICYLSDAMVNELSMQLYFDPLLPNPKIALQFEPNENDQVKVRYIPNSALVNGISRVGDQWELSSRSSAQVLAVIKLAQISASKTQGVYNFMFSVVTPATTIESSHLALNLLVDESSKRMPQLQSFLIFSQQSATKTIAALSSKHVQIQEFERDEDSNAASVWVYPLPNTTALKPSIEAIECQHPEFAKALETPNIRSSHGAFQVEFKLKRGCIQGLNDTLDAKAKSCVVKLNLDEGKRFSETLWISLQDRPCAPKIESLARLNPTPEQDVNQVRWRFRIIDADNDLKASDISVVGSNSYSVFIESATGDKEGLSEFNGVVSLDYDCRESALNIVKHKVFLRAKDQTGLSTQRPLSTPLNCPALASTEGGNLEFRIDEGEHLSVPIYHAQDVKLELNAPFGSLIDGSFEWNATCLYGRGPHSVSINAEAPNRYGLPLALKVFVQRCQGRFKLNIDDVVLNPAVPIVILPGQSKTIHISDPDIIDSFEFSASLNTVPSELELTESTDQAYHLTMACKRFSSIEKLSIQAKSKDNDDKFLPLAPIKLEVHCLLE